MFLLFEIKRFHPLIQLRAGSVSAEGVIRSVDVFDVLQRCQVNLSRINVSAALRVEPVVQDGKQAVLGASSSACRAFSLLAILRYAPPRAAITAPNTASIQYLFIHSIISHLLPPSQHQHRHGKRICASETAGWVMHKDAGALVIALRDNLHIPAKRSTGIASDTLQSSEGRHASL